MGKKKRSRRNSDDENKENRLEKRLKRLERRDKKNRRAYRRKKRRRESSSSSSSSDSSSTSSGSSSSASSRSNTTSNSEDRARSRARSRGRSRDRSRIRSRDRSRIRSRDRSRDQSHERNLERRASVEVHTVQTTAPMVEAPVAQSGVAPPATQQNVTPPVTQPPTNDGRAENVEVIGAKQKIDTEALEALGKHLTINKPPGPPICEELVTRWTEILTVGLPKDDKAELLRKHGTPENCLGINPPKLNPEVKASLSEPVTSRDTRLIAKQEKVTVCISALGGVLSKLLCGETIDRLPLIEVLSDVEKLLVDLQRDESLTRKALIVANLNSSIKDALNATAIDEWLFGKQLDENIKTAKTLERSSKQIKAISKGPFNQTAKNFKSPLRQQSFKQRGTSGSGQRKPYAPRNTGHRRSETKNEKYSRKKRQ